MHRQHDVKRLRMGQAKESFQHMHHKFHRRVVIVQQHDFIQRWPRCFRLCLGQNRGVIVTTLTGFIRHMMRRCSHKIGPLAERAGFGRWHNIAFFPLLERPRALAPPNIPCNGSRMDTRPITTIGFDADDTLWQNEAFFRLTQDHIATLLADYAAPDHLHDRLLAAERRNLGHYGYGVKGFTLSMIETAIEVTDGRVPAAVIAEIIAAGREMLAHPIDLLPHAAATVTALASEFRVLLITKGDLLDQERKLAQSGLGDLFHGVEIVSDKTPATYTAIFTRHGDGPARALMVGNSLKSDVLPVIAAGGHGVHIPHALTWALEVADPPQGHARFHAIENLGELPYLVGQLVRTP
jgi:putative hydrolase of the HAD superfamily